MGKSSTWEDFKNAFGLTQKEPKPLVKDDVYEAFLHNLELEGNTLAGKLLKTILKLFFIYSERSETLTVYYHYWRTELRGNSIPTRKRTPVNWQCFISHCINSDSTLKHKDAMLIVMFSIESLLVLISRLILCKMCDNFRLPGLSFIDHFESSGIKGKDYQHCVFPFFVGKMIQSLKERLNAPVIDERLYLWWIEPTDLLSKNDDDAMTTVIKDFGANLQKLLSFISSFNFSGLNDLLGDLYRCYFGDETRKALGEFYTDQVVIERILNDVGYTKDLSDKRLLDPACGSGSFLVTALHRYLDQRSDEKNGEWGPILNDLCSDGRIVGFDINPFACAISQNRLLMELIPYLKRALDESKDYRLPRIPIYCTDTLILDAKVMDNRTLKDQIDIKWKNPNQFDFVVGNPPFVRVTSIPKKKRDYYLGRLSNPQTYESARSRLNLYILFIERCISKKIGLLKPGGKFGFILPTSFMVYEGYGRKIREIIFRDSQILKLINLNLCARDVFTQDVSTSILILRKTGSGTQDRTEEGVGGRKFTSIVLKSITNFKQLIKISDEPNQTAQYDVYEVDSGYLTCNPFGFQISQRIISPLYSEQNIAILMQMHKIGVRLEDIASLNQGIRIGSKRVRKLVIKKRGQYAKLTAHEQVKCWRPMLNSRETGKFSIRWKGRFLKFYHDKEEEKLYLPKSDERKRTMDAELTQPKLFMNNTGQYLRVSCDFGVWNGKTKRKQHTEQQHRQQPNEAYFFPLNTLYYIVAKPELDYKSLGFEKQSDFMAYVAAFLNSSLGEFWYRCNFWALAIPSGSIKYREVIKDIPIPIEKKHEENLPEVIIEKVYKILENNDNTEAQNQKSSQASLRQQIDECFYALLGIDIATREHISQFLAIFCPKGIYECNINEDGREAST